MAGAGIETATMRSRDVLHLDSSLRNINLIQKPVIGRAGFLPKVRRIMAAAKKALPDGTYVPHGKDVLVDCHQPYFLTLFSEL